MMRCRDGASVRALWVLAGLLLVAGCDPILDRAAYNAKTHYVAVSGLTMNVSTASVTYGGPLVTLTATVAPANASDQRVIWSSASPSIVGVDSQGRVYAVQDWGGYSVTVTARSLDTGATASATVTILY